MSLEDRSSRRIIMKGRKSNRVVEKRIGEEGRRSGEKCQKKDMQRIRRPHQKSSSPFFLDRFESNL